MAAQVLEFIPDASAAPDLEFVPDTKDAPDKFSSEKFTVKTSVADTGAASLAAMNDQDYAVLSGAKLGDTVTLSSGLKAKMIEPDIWVSKKPSKSGQAPSELETTVQSFVRGVPGAAGAAVGLGYVKPLSTSLRSIPRVGPGLGLITDVAGGIGGAIFADTAKDVVVQESQESKERFAAGESANPKSAALGRVVSQAPVFGISGASALERATMGLVGGGIPVVIEGVPAAITGKEIQPGLAARIAEGVVGGSIFANPRKIGDDLIELGSSALGSKFFGNVAGGAAKVIEKKLAPKIKLPEIKVGSRAITDSLGNVKAGDPLNKVTAASNDIAMGDIELGVKGEAPYIQEPAPRIEYEDFDVTSPAEKSALVFAIQDERAAEAARRVAPMQEPAIKASETELAKGVRTKADVDYDYALQNQKQVENYQRLLKETRQSERNADAARAREAEGIKAVDEAKALSERENYAQELAFEVSQQEGIPLQDVINSRKAHPTTDAWIEDLESIFINRYKLSETPKPTKISDLVESGRAKISERQAKERIDLAETNYKNDLARAREPAEAQASRAADVEAALADAERVRMSQKGGQDLKADLASQQKSARGVMPELSDPSNVARLGLDTSGKPVMPEIKSEGTPINELVEKSRSALRRKNLEEQKSALAARNEKTKAFAEQGLGEGEGFQPVELKESMDFEGQPVNTQKQAQEIKTFNERVIKVQENLKAEGVELDRQTAVKLALIKDPQEFNAARQQLINSVNPPKTEIPKSGPIKSLQEIPGGTKDKATMPEVVSSQDLVNPKMPEIAATKPLEQALPPVGQAKAAKSQAKPIVEATAPVVEKPVVAEKPIVPEVAPEKPVVDAKEAIIQDPNLDAETKIEILQKMATSKPKQDTKTLAQKLLERKRQVDAEKPKPVASKTVRLTKNDAEEIGHKMGVLADSPDLQDDYGLTQQQADTLRDSVPLDGGDWKIPDFAMEAVKSEIKDHSQVLRDIAADARSGAERGQALRIDKQAKRLDKLIPEPVKEDTRFDDAESRIYEAEINDDKRGVVSAANKAFNDGLITKEQLNEIKRVAKDKDMGAEDVGSQLRGDLEFNRTKAKESPKTPVIEQKPAPEVEQKPVVEPVVQEEVSSPAKILEEKLSYIDEQLASKEITKEEHTAMVKQAKENFRSSQVKEQINETKKDVNEFEKKQDDAYEEAQKSPKFEEVVQATMEFKKANKLAKFLAEHPLDYSPSQRAAATRKANAAAQKLQDIQRSANIPTYASFRIMEEAGRRLRNQSPSNVLGPTSNRRGPTSNSGNANLYVLANVAAPAVGAVIGSTQGDTPEERIKNIFLFAGAFSGTTAGITALAKAAKSNPSLLKTFKEGFQEAKRINSEPSNLKAKIQQEVPSSPETPGEIAAESIVPQIGQDRRTWNPIIKDRKWGSFWDKTYTHIDSLLEVAPEMAGSLRNWMREKDSLISDAFNRSISPLSQLRQLVGKKAFDSEVSKYLFNGRESELLAALDNTPEGKVVADGLRNGWIKDRPQILQALKEANPNKDYGELENYWPRKIADLKGLKQKIDSVDKSFVTKSLDDALKAKQKEYGQGTKLSAEEEEQAITSALTRVSAQGTSGRMGNLQQRKLASIGDDLIQFYEPADVSLLKYYTNAFDTTLRSKYLGRSDPEAATPWMRTDAGIMSKQLSDRIGVGDITEDGIARVERNINSFVKSTQGHPISHLIANKAAYVQVASNLGQLSSALMNLTDVFKVASHMGFKDAAGAMFIDPFVKSSRRKSLSDLGLDERLGEVYEQSRTGGAASWILDNTILPLFRFTDKIGKTLPLNASTRFLERNVADIKAGGKGDYNFEFSKNRFTEMYGKKEWESLIKAVDEGDWSNEVINKFAYNKLADMQPISKAEMVIGKSEADALGKVAFGLTSFMLKQMNTFRSRTYAEARNGNYENAAKYASVEMAYLAMAGAAAGVMKDIIAGKDIEDTSATNGSFGMLLQMVGLNKVTLGQIARGEYATVVGERALPGLFRPAKIIKQDLGLAYKMATGEEELSLSNFGKKAEITQIVPLLGSPFYNRFGPGATRADEVSRKRGEDSSDAQRIIDIIVGPDTRQRDRR